MTALVPNLRGAQSAFDTGVQKVTIPFLASEAHSLANVRKSHDQSLIRSSSGEKGCASVLSLVNSQKMVGSHPRLSFAQH